MINIVSFFNNHDKRESNMNELLKFNDNDLVYGPKADGALRKWQQKFGGKLLDDVADPYYNGYAGDWIARSIHHLNLLIKHNNVLHFDLTYMEDIDNLLIGNGIHADKITSYELRYVRDNWSIFKFNTKFYKNNEEASKPW